MGSDAMEEKEKKKSRDKEKKKKKKPIAVQTIFGNGIDRRKKKATFNRKRLPMSTNCRVICMVVKTKPGGVEPVKKERVGGEIGVCRQRGNCIERKT
jgi:hypothetical protein